MNNLWEILNNASKFMRLVRVCAKLCYDLFKAVS